MSEIASGEAVSDSDATDKVFSCSKCGSEHDTQTGLSIHESKVHGGPVDGSGNDCPGCDRSYASQQGLIAHLSGENSCGAGFECEDCERTFPTKRGWRHHRKQVHNVDTRPEITCVICGETKKIDPNLEQKSERHFCSQDCVGEWLSQNLSGADNPQYKENIELTCVVCGEPYSVTPARSDSICCSVSCRGEYVSKNYSGEDSAQWKGGSVRYYGENWHEQRKKALERDEYTCQSCGKDMSEGVRDPDVHHIKRLGYYKEKYNEPKWWELGNRLENLVCLCRTCHNKWEGIPVAPRLL